MTIERQATYEGDTILLRLVKPLEYSGITTSYLEERIVQDASNFSFYFYLKLIIVKSELGSRAEH